MSLYKEGKGRPCQACPKASLGCLLVSRRTQAPFFCPTHMRAYHRGYQVTDREGGVWKRGQDPSKKK